MSRVERTEEPAASSNKQGTCFYGEVILARQGCAVCQVKAKEEDAQDTAETFSLAFCLTLQKHACHIV